MAHFTSFPVRPPLPSLQPLSSFHLLALPWNQPYIIIPNYIGMAPIIGMTSSYLIKQVPYRNGTYLIIPNYIGMAPTYFNLKLVLNKSCIEYLPEQPHTILGKPDSVRQPENYGGRDIAGGSCPPWLATVAIFGYSCLPWRDWPDSEGQQCNCTVSARISALPWPVQPSNSSVARNFAQQVAQKSR